MSLRSLLCLLACALSHAWQGVGLAARPAQRVASSAIAMKHNDYFQRVQRAESGRLRLCVFRCVAPAARARRLRRRGPCRRHPSLRLAARPGGPTRCRAAKLSALAPAPGCPLVCPRRSNNHIYGQVIDDSKDAVICAASTMEKDAREASGANCAAAAEVGKRLGERAKAKGVEKVFFDRNGKPYHGRIKALADGAREAGLSF